jgi:hypothetical protein
MHDLWDAIETDMCLYGASKNHKDFIFYDILNISGLKLYKPTVYRDQEQFYNLKNDVGIGNSDNVYKLIDTGAYGVPIFGDIIIGFNDDNVPKNLSGKIKIRDLTVVYDTKHQDVVSSAIPFITKYVGIIVNSGNIIDTNMLTACTKILTILGNTYEDSLAYTYTIYTQITHNDNVDDFVKIITKSSTQKREKKKGEPKKKQNEKTKRKNAGQKRVFTTKEVRIETKRDVINLLPQSKTNRTPITVLERYCPQKKIQFVPADDGIAFM